MPHTNGHTTIEMSSRSRSRSPAPHENSSVHSRLLDPKPYYSRGSSPNNEWRHNQPNNVPGLHNNTSLVPPYLRGSKPSLSSSATNLNITDEKHSGSTDRVQPLLEKDASKPKPPIAGPEIDDLDEDSDISSNPEAHPGVDDGFFHTEGSGIGPRFGEDGKPNIQGGGDKKDDKNGIDIPATELDIEKAWHDVTSEGDEHDGFIPNEDPTRAGTPFPYPPDHVPGVVVDTRVTPDVNVYQQKKNLAQGMMDLALLSANANQLRYVLEAGDYHPYYYASLIFISFSLILQIGVGVGLIINSRYDVKHHDDICKADRINDFTVIGIFLITVVNVFIASFGVAQLPSPSDPRT